MTAITMLTLGKARFYNRDQLGHLFITCGCDLNSVQCDCHSMTEEANDAS